MWWLLLGGLGGLVTLTLLEEKVKGKKFAVLGWSYPALVEYLGLVFPACD